MPTKKHRPKEINGRLREVEIVLGQRETTAEAPAAPQLSKHEANQKARSPFFR